MKNILFILCLPILASAQGYWQQKVDYKMNINFDVKNHQFSGTTQLTYWNHSPDTLNRVFFHLYLNAFQPNSMMDVRSRTIEDPDQRVKDRIYNLKPNEIGFQKIASLTQDGETTTYITEGTVLEVKLASPILPGSSTVFNLGYESQVPLQVRRNGRNSSEGIDYSMAQWFPKIAEYDKSGWHAHPYVGREFYSPWGNYEVDITIDKNYILAASGILQNPIEIGYGYAPENMVKRPKGKTLTWKFKAENVHDFMWAADRDYVHEIYPVENGPELHFFYQRDSNTVAWNELPKLTAMAFNYMNENFGKYPYPVFNVIQGGDGGMEYPMSTLITGNRKIGSLLGVTVHEAFHSWYQGVLATNESYYEWMDEGFTSYGTSVTMGYLAGESAGRSMSGNYRGYFALAASGKEEPMSTHADHYETNFAYGRAAYSKGAVSLAQLGYIIGDQTLKAGLIRYFNEWKFKHPDLNDFIRVMEKTSDLELDWYYDYWVNSTKTIDYSIDTLSESDGKTMVTLKRIGKIPMPLDILITYNNGTQSLVYVPLDLMRGEKVNESAMERIITKDWPWTHPTYTFSLNTSLANIKSIEIDASLRMADVDRSNNLYSK